MTVDQYALCPCGNGKKIKFCKCKDSLPELDRVMTMIEGRQVVPAIDRLNQVLTEHPDAAWALAIKGRLMIDLREYDTLAENSERFVRLQPSNPLALAQRSASELFRNEPQKATLSLLEALTESGRAVDSFVLDIASILAYSLANAGLFLTARAYVQLPLTATGYEANQTAAMVYQELNSSEEINQLLKGVPAPLPRDDDATWGERFDEAMGLLRSNQILLAESKLQSLARTVPREPCVLTGLLTCAIWRGDGAGQSECLRKLSECAQLESLDRAKYLAMSWLVEPGQPMLTAESKHLTAEVEHIDQVEMAFQASPRFVSIDPTLLNDFGDANDGVRPRSGFQLLDRDAPDSKSVPKASDFPLALAVVILYGKQTDRAARIEVPEVREAVRDSITQAIHTAVGDLTWTETADRPVSLLEVIAPQPAFVGDESNRAEIASVQKELMKRLPSERIASTPMKCLGNRSIQDAASDHATDVTRLALVRLIEGFEALDPHGSGLLSVMCKAASLPELPTLLPSNLDEVKEIEPVELGRVDVTQLDTESLLFLFRHAKFFSSTHLLRIAAKRILELDLEETLKPAKVMAYVTLVENAESSDEALDLIEKGKAYATANQLDQANLRIIELTHRLMTGDSVGFSQTLRSIAEQYGQRPEVMARVQRLLMSVGIMRPDGSLREAPGASGMPGFQASPAASNSGAGIWTPGSEAAAAGTATSGGSKLWIPGMD